MRSKINFLLKNILAESSWAYAVVLTAAYALKYHYSHAKSMDLIWILTPTAKLAGWLSGLAFIFESDAGYINLGKNICIAPACAGVNFLIILFCMAAWMGIHHLRTCPAKMVWLVASAVLSYAVTLCVNACRIAVSVWLYSSDFYRPWISQEEMHQLMGIILYLGFLYGFFYVVQYVFFRCGRPQNGSLAASGLKQGKGGWYHLLPLMAYLSITILVPLLNNAHQIYGRQFFLHSLWVAGVGIGIYGLIMGVRLGYVKLIRAHSETASFGPGPYSRDSVGAIPDSGCWIYKL